MKGKIAWSGSNGIILPRDFYHFSAICVRLQVSNINGVCFCFSGPTGRHYCTKEVIISIWVSQALLPHPKTFVIKSWFPEGTCHTLPRTPSMSLSEVMSLPQCQETPRSGSQAPGWAVEGGTAWTVSAHGQPWDLLAQIVNLSIHSFLLHPSQAKPMLSHQPILTLLAE